MENARLKKSVTVLEAMAIVIGMIIGSGIFLKPGIVLHNAGSQTLGLLAWAAGGVVTLAAALTVSEITSAIPRSGGLYTYLGDLYGRPVGFLLGWVQTIVAYPASVAALAIAFSTYAAYFVPMGALQQKFLAVGALAFVLLMNVLATKCGGVIQTAATIGKLIPVVGIIVFGLASHSASTAAAAAVPQAVPSAAGFGVAVLGTLWAYDGWISVTNMAGELKNPAKSLPRVIASGVLFVIAVYVLFNLATYRVLPFSVIVASNTPGAEAAKALFGGFGGTFITAGIMLSVFGALNGYLMTSARVPQTMGENGELPFSRMLGAVQPRLRTPANALIAEAALAVVYIFSGTFDSLTDITMFVLWIFFTMGVFGIFLLRRKTRPEPGRYHVPFFPVTPLVGIVGGAYILVSTVIQKPVPSLIGILITLTGLPVYLFLNRYRPGAGKAE